MKYMLIMLVGLAVGFSTAKLVEPNHFDNYSEARTEGYHAAMRDMNFCK